MMTSEAHFIIFLVLSLLLFLDISGAQATEGGNDLSPRREASLKAARVKAFQTF